MTRQELIDKYIDENRARTAAEAERYKDKQMDEPKPNYVPCGFQVGQVVWLKLEGDPQPGHVIEIRVRQGPSVAYLVMWPHLRDATEHHGFELEIVPDGDKLACL